MNGREFHKKTSKKPNKYDRRNQPTNQKYNLQ